MPWKEASIMSQRLEFVALATAEGANIRLRCRRFGISPKSAYKWIHRFQERGEVALRDRSRRPRCSPGRTPSLMEGAILEVRDSHPMWGARKIRARLEMKGMTSLASVSTITAILRRNGRIDPEEVGKHKPWQRFEAETSNALWQMDFKGHFQVADVRCHPLTVLEDHSRYLLGEYACGDERWRTVQGHLTTVSRRYGLPERMLVDNGSPWASNEIYQHTPLTVWLMHLGVEVSHSRPCFPQTLGKCERLYRTLKAEAIGSRTFRSLEHCQQQFDLWRYVYNFQRPHEALSMAVPASRYRESPREFPESLPPIEYAPGDELRKVQIDGPVCFRGRGFNVGKAFRGRQEALRPACTDGVFNVFFCHYAVAQVDLNDHNAEA